MNQFAKPGLAEEKLPPVSSADNGKVLGVNNGVWDKVAASGGSDLPEVTADDKNKYLHTNSSTGDLEWSAVSGGSGGLFVVGINAAFLDKTWQEIFNAATSGSLVVLEETGEESIKRHYFFGAYYDDEDFNAYVIDFGDAGYFAAATVNDYPELQL